MVCGRAGFSVAGYVCVAAATSESEFIICYFALSSLTLIMTGAEILRGPQDVDISIPAIYYITTAIGL